MKQFKTEVQMKNYVVKNLFCDLNSIYKSTNPHLLDEVPYSSGVTDLVVVNLSNKLLNNRIEELGHKRFIRNFNYLRLYLKIKDLKYIDKTSLKKSFNTDSSNIYKAMNWLKKYGFIEETRNVIYPSRYFKHITASIAFELKLSNWKVALNQAFRAKSYSEKQYVVLDEKHIQGALKNIEYFKQFNIGLISVGPNSKSKLYFSSKKTKPFSPLATWWLNEYSLNDMKKIVCRIN